MDIDIVGIGAAFLSILAGLGLSVLIFEFWDARPSKWGK